MDNAKKIPTKIPFIDVDSDNPYKEDALGRKELCEKWTNFIERSTTPYVMAIDGKWGAGKTALLRMWEADLKNKGFRCVFFDAWQADFYGQALPALIGEITKQIPDKKFTEKVKKVSGALFTLSTAMNTISPIVPGGKAAAELAKALGQSLKDHDAVENYHSYREAVDKFKNSLEEFASNGESGKPLVIFVDELDRCRPDFALEVLEKVKHVFDVKSVFFVFAINKGEMSKTIETVYGGIDSERYLRKFFDHTFLLISKGGLGETAFVNSGLKGHLEERVKDGRAYLAGRNPTGHKAAELTSPYTPIADTKKRSDAKYWAILGYTSMATSEAQEVVDAYKGEMEDELSNFWEYWKAMIAHFDVSLRDEAQILSALNISFRTIPSHRLTYPLVLAYFAILKVANSALYENCKIALYSKGKIPFPHQELADYYREQAGFGDAKDSIPDNDEDKKIYATLCAIRIQEEETYKQRINELVKGGVDTRFWELVKDIWCYRVPRDFADFFETLDSIGGFPVEPGKKR